jgi:arylsulfatase A-like enzyme
MKIAVIAASILLLIYLLAPMSSARYAIEFDAEGIFMKEEYLDRLAEVPASRERQPNIVIILADDLGKTDISAYGGLNVPTPAMDAIGEAGFIFDYAYTTAPICSASRAAMLTGRYQQRYGYETQPMTRYPVNRLEYFGYKYFIDTGAWVVAEMDAVPRNVDILRQGLPLSEIALPEILQGRGYSTGIMGKWHLGYEAPFSPLNWGFDEYYGFDEAFTLYAPVDDPDIVNHRHDYFASRHIWGQGRSGPSAILRNDVTIEEEEYLTFAIAREATDFIERNQDEPFFLYASFSAPHTPFQAPRAYYDRFAHVEDENKRVYYAMIAALDDAIGQITDKLDELGLAENTLLVFASDNGGAAYTGATENAPLQGGKFNFFEGGVNVPMMARWPGVLSGGEHYTRPVSLMDVFSTAVNAAGAPLPEDRIIDGMDLRERIAGTGEDVFFWRALHYKGILAGDWKLIQDGKSGNARLHQLADDPYESQNLVQERPEIKEQLQTMMSAWETDLAEPLWPRVMDYRLEMDGETYFCPL